MSDIISRQAVIELVKNSYYNLADEQEDVWAMVKDVEQLPSAERPQNVIAQITFDEEKLCEIVKEAVERFKEEYEIIDRPTGEWKIDEYGIHHCPICHAINNTVYKSFCPNCGAKMK